MGPPSPPFRRIKGNVPPTAAPSACKDGARRCSRRSRSPREPAGPARPTASSVNSMPTSSVASSAVYCFTSELLAPPEFRRKSSSLRLFSSTRSGKRPLQLGDQVRRLADVEGARGDEENVVGGARPVLRHHRAALDDRQDVPLHALGETSDRARPRDRPPYPGSSRKMMPLSSTRSMATRTPRSGRRACRPPPSRKMRRASATVVCLWRLLVAGEHAFPACPAG